MKYATVIGSRNITKDERRKLHIIVEQLLRQGYIIRSGGAKGADSVVTQNVPVNQREIIIPWEGFEHLKTDRKNIYKLKDLPDQDIARETVERIHPATYTLTYTDMQFHIRNVYQITGTKGVNRNNLSQKVVYCANTKNGIPTGGTRTAVVVAKKLGIPTYNIRSEKK